MSEYDFDDDEYDYEEEDPPEVLLNQEFTCSICQDEECTHTQMRLGCGHLFHAHCLALWFRENSACPLCRDDPVLEPVCVEERAKHVRRFSKTKRAPKGLKRLVQDLQNKEFSRKERKVACDKFKKKHSKIFKEMSRLKLALRCANDSVSRGMRRLGMYHCDGMPVPPIRGE